MDEEEMFTVKTLAKLEPQIYPSSRAEAGLLLENQETTTYIRTISFVSGPMQTELVRPDSQDRLRTRNVVTQPGVLIGNGYFLDTVLSNNFFMKQLPDGYKLVHTLLGNVITGKILQNYNLWVTTSYS